MKKTIRDRSGTTVRNPGVSRTFRDGWQLCYCNAIADHVSASNLASLSCPLALAAYVTLATQYRWRAFPRYGTTGSYAAIYLFLQGGSTDTQSSKPESHESEGGLFVGVKTTAEVGLITSDSHSESLDTTTTSMFNDVGVKTMAEVGLITSDSHSESLDSATTSMFNDVVYSCTEHE